MESCKRQTHLKGRRHETTTQPKTHLTLPKPNKLSTQTQTQTRGTIHNFSSTLTHLRVSKKM